MDEERWKISITRAACYPDEMVTPTGFDLFFVIWQHIRRRTVHWLHGTRSSNAELCIYNELITYRNPYMQKGQKCRNVAIQHWRKILFEIFIVWLTPHSFHWMTSRGCMCLFRYITFLASPHNADRWQPSQFSFSFSLLNEKSIHKSASSVQLCNAVLILSVGLSDINSKDSKVPTI